MASTKRPRSQKLNKTGVLYRFLLRAKIYGQALYIEGLNVIGAGRRNVVFVATASDSVYAFDADDPNSSNPLWRATLLLGGEVPGSAADVGASHRIEPLSIPICGVSVKPYTDMIGNIGATGTPVIDVEAQTLYVVAKSKRQVRGLGFSVTKYFRL
jgi:hypothetical protein